MQNHVVAIVLLTSLILIPAPASARRADPQPPVVGVWVLKSISVAGKSVKNAPEVLKDFGGVEVGMKWKFRKFEDDNGGCVLGEADCGYEYLAETKELIVDRETKDIDAKQVFEAKIDAKTMKLSYKQDKKPIALTFSKEK